MVQLRGQIFFLVMRRSAARRWQRSVSRSSRQFTLLTKIGAHCTFGSASSGRLIYPTGYKCNHERYLRDRFHDYGTIICTFPCSRESPWLRHHDLCSPICFAVSLPAECLGDSRARCSKTTHRFLRCVQVREYSW